MRLYAVIEAEEIDDSGEERTLIKIFPDETQLSFGSSPSVEFYTDDPSSFKVNIPKNANDKLYQARIDKFKNEAVKFILRHFSI